MGTHKLALRVNVGLELHHGVLLALPVLVDLVGQEGEVGLLSPLPILIVAAHSQDL